MGTINGNILYDVIQSFHKTCKVIISSVYPLAEQKKIIPGALDYFDKAQGIDVLLGKIKNALQM